jgi:hypothetical protein
MIKKIVLSAFISMFLLWPVIGTQLMESRNSAFAEPGQRRIDIRIEEHWGYWTDGFSVPSDVDVPLEMDWLLMGHVTPDSSPISNFKITLDSRGIQYFRGWGGGWDIIHKHPDECLHGPEDTWDYNWWLWHELLPTDPLHPFVHLGGTNIIKEPLGFGASRSANKTEFSKPDIQHVTATVEVKKPGRFMIEIGSGGGLVPKNGILDAKILSETANPTPLWVIPEALIQWYPMELQPGVYEFSVDIQIIPKEAYVTFVPEVSVSEFFEEESLPGLTMTSTSVTFIDFEVRSMLGTVTFSSDDTVIWTGTSSIRKRVIFRSLVSTPARPVGGVWVPVNKFELLAPWISLALLMTVATASVIYVKHGKKQRN